MSSLLNLNLLHLIRIYEFYYPEVCDIWKWLIQEERDVCTCYRRSINLLRSTTGPVWRYYGIIGCPLFITLMNNFLICVSGPQTYEINIRWCFSAVRRSSVQEVQRGVERVA